MTLERQAELIGGATGLSGRNVDYLRDLVEHLREMGVGRRDGDAAGDGFPSPFRGCGRQPVVTMIWLVHSASNAFDAVSIRSSSTRMNSARFRPGWMGSRYSNTINPG